MTVAIISAVGAITASVLNLIVIYMLKTPSGTRIGKQVEDAQHVGLGNHYKLQQIEQHLGLNEDEAA